MKHLLRIAFVVILATTTFSASAQFYTSDRRSTKYDRSRYNHPRSEYDVVDVYNSRPGELDKKLSPGEQESVRFLIIDGPLNGDDFKFLRELCKRKKCLNKKGNTIDNYIDLDLSRAHIVSGGSSYYSYYKTHRDELGDYLFYEATCLRSIILPDYIRFIGKNAFRNCYNLEEVIMPSTVTEICDGAFDNCYDLRYIYLNEGIEAVGRDAFSSCNKIKEIYLPSTLKHIGANAFYSTGLTQVELPQGLETIGASAFEHTSLKSLIIPANAGIENNKIGNISSLQEIQVIEGNRYYSSIDGILYDKSARTIILCPKALTGNVEIPDGVTTITDYTFADCDKITSISLPPSVTSIGDEAFYSCSSLTGIVMPPQISSFGKKVFSHCSKLTSINLPDGITVLPQETFRDCKALTYVSLPMSLTTIGKEAFRNTKALQSIELPLGIKVIEKEAFRSSALLSIDLPNGLQSIGDNAFREVEFTSLVIPESVTTIGKSIIEKSKKITSITCLAATPPALAKVSNEKLPLYVPAQSVDDYKNAKNWKKFKQILPLND